MKETYLKIDNDAVDWLKQLITNTLANPNHPTTIACYDALAAWDKSLNNPVSPSELVAPQPVSKPRATRTRKKKKVDKHDKNNPLICNAHPTYGGIRFPRTDCASCREVYKRLHPLDYNQKLAAWKRKNQGKKNEAS